MPNQLSAVSGNRRLRRNQIAELNARQALLPQIITNKQRQEDIVREEELSDIQIGQFNRQHKLNKRALSTQRRAGEVGMGLEAAKFGFNIGNRYGGTTVGNVRDSTSKLFSGGNSIGTNASQGGFLNNLSIGSAIGGGLAGFGAAKMLGKKKSKITKGLVGAGTGALMGLLSGGGLSSAISGAFGGGFGSLFG